VAIDVGIGHEKPGARSAALVPPFKPGGRCEEPRRRGNEQSARAALLRSEEDLARKAVSDGEAALLAALAADARVLRNQSLPALGLQAARGALGERNVPVAYAVGGSEVSGSGDLGYVYGTSETAGAGGVSKSAYLRIWRRGADGRWSVVLDLASPIPSPKP
jgi:ketosteroid isomerase-like protein